MARSTLTRHKVRFTIMIIALMLVTSVSLVAAQGSGPTLVQTAEYDIGFDCPQAAVLDPAGTTLWVLMDNCGQEDYTLHAYNVADGTPLNVADWSEALTSLEGGLLDWFITPMAFTPAGDLSIRYSDPNTYEISNLVIPLASGGEATTPSSASFNDLLVGLSPYPEFSIYSPDHTRVVAIDESAFHVIDVQAEREITTIPVEGGVDGAATAIFSAGGEHLVVISYVNPDNMDDYTCNVQIYSLPNGTLLSQYTLPAPPLALSPDETKAAVNLASNNIGDQSDLVIIDLNTGLASPALSLLEAPKPVTNCLNDGRDVSDVGFMTDGYLGLTSLQWLSDNSGVVVALSAFGDGAGGDAGFCAFNNSRLRLYSVGSGG